MWGCDGAAGEERIIHCFSFLVVRWFVARFLNQALQDSRKSSIYCFSLLVARYFVSRFYKSGTSTY
jgi:hypothetical protein